MQFHIGQDWNWQWENTRIFRCMSALWDRSTEAAVWIGEVYLDIYRCQARSCPFDAELTNTCPLRACYLLWPHSSKILILEIWSSTSGSFSVYSFCAIFAFPTFVSTMHSTMHHLRACLFDLQHLPNFTQSSIACRSFYQSGISPSSLGTKLHFIWSSEFRDILILNIPATDALDNAPVPSL